MFGSGPTIEGDSHLATIITQSTYFILYKKTNEVPFSAFASFKYSHSKFGKFAGFNVEKYGFPIYLTFVILDSRFD